MRQLPVLQPACGRRCVIVGWLAAMFIISALFVAATISDGAQSHGCGWALSHLGEWKMALPPALLALLALAAVITWGMCRCGIGGWWKRHRVDMVPLLTIVFPVCAFTVVYAVGWWGVCDVMAPHIAPLASAGVVLSVVMFGIYRDMYGTRKTGLPRGATILLLVMATTSFTHHILQAADGRGPQDIQVILQSLAAIATVATAVAAGVFGVEYGKNRGQSLKWGWVLSIVLIAVGIFAHVVSDVASQNVGNSGDIHLYATQAVWAGVTIAVAMLAAHMPELPKKCRWSWLAVVLALALAALTVPYYAISSEWMCLTSADRCPDPPGPIKSAYDQLDYEPLRPWAFVTILLAIWNVIMGTVVAMLEGAMAARMRTWLTP